MQSVTKMNHKLLQQIAFTTLNTKLDVDVSEVGTVFHCVNITHVVTLLKELSLLCVEAMKIMMDNRTVSEMLKSRFTFSEIPIVTLVTPHKAAHCNETFNTILQ